MLVPMDLNLLCLALDSVSELEEDQAESRVIDSGSKSHDALAGLKATSSRQNSRQSR